MFWPRRGPEFQFGPPTSDFLRWPSVVGKSRIDMPRIGTSTALFWLGFQPFFNGVQSFSIIFICFLGEGISFQVLFCFCFFFLGLFFFFLPCLLLGFSSCLVASVAFWLP